MVLVELETQVLFLSIRKPTSINLSISFTDFKGSKEGLWSLKGKVLPFLVPRIRKKRKPPGTRAYLPEES